MNHMIIFYIKFLGPLKSSQETDFIQHRQQLNRPLQHDLFKKATSLKKEKKRSSSINICSIEKKNPAYQYYFKTAIFDT